MLKVKKSVICLLATQRSTVYITEQQSILSFRMIVRNCQGLVSCNKAFWNINHSTLIPNGKENWPCKLRCVFSNLLESAEVRLVPATDAQSGFQWTKAVFNTLDYPENIKYMWWNELVLTALVPENVSRQCDDENLVCYLPYLEDPIHSHRLIEIYIYIIHRSYLIEK
jgi:hypothetical protein